MQDYLKHRKSLDSKSKKSSDTSEIKASTVSPSDRIELESRKAFESRMSSDMQQMFSQMMDQFRNFTEKNTNPSFAAPSIVPDCPPDTGGAGGNGRQMC